MPLHDPSSRGVPRRAFLTQMLVGASGMTLVGPAVRVASAIAPTRALDTTVADPRPRPTPAQLTWQADGLALFLHFGMNTFTDREWGDGQENPALFAPAQVDARQWARVAKAAGAKALILTAKHHDGFCLWPTATTSHSVAASPWQAGQGDVVREFVEACRAEGLKAGLYCSPWDRNHVAYGDSPRYNDIYAAQLTELLTHYGRIDEVWFDGANGEGPNGKRQVYDWPRIWALVRRLQPEAIMFSDAGPDVRWIGNERGVAGETHWSTIRPDAVPVPGVDGPEVIRALQEGHADGTVWRPGETDVSIRPGWFHHANEDTRVKSVEQLVDLYFTSVGRNSKLLLNVPPTRDGRLHDADVAQLLGMRRALDALFAREVVPASATWTVTGTHTGERTVRFAVPRRLRTLDLREDIAQGQQVSRWSLHALDAARTVLARGTTVGYRQLRRLPAVTASGVLLRVETLDAVRPVTLRVYS